VHHVGSYYTDSLFLSDRMGELDSYRTDFREIWYWRFLRNNVNTVKLWLKLNKNYRYFAWRPTCTYENFDYLIYRGYLGRHCKNVSYGCYSYLCHQAYVCISVCRCSLVVTVRRTRHELFLRRTLPILLFL
jgi:hypothetical protein